MELDTTPEVFFQNVQEVDNDPHTTVLSTASKNLQEFLVPLNLFHDTSEVGKFLDGNVTNGKEILIELTDKVGYHFNYFSIQDGANPTGPKLKCELCNVILCIKNVEKHVLKKQHLEILRKTCPKSTTTDDTFISNENWDYLDFIESSQQYRCSLCDIDLLSNNKVWAEHFQSNSHRIKLKESKPEVIISVTDTLSSPSRIESETFGAGSGEVGIVELSVRDIPAQRSKTALDDLEVSEPNELGSNLKQYTRLEDLIGLQMEDLKYDEKKIVKMLGNKLQDEIHFFKLTYMGGPEKLYFICKVCVVVLRPIKVESHSATNQHANSLQTNSIAMPLESFNDSDRKIVTDLSNRLGSKINFFALTFKCGSNRLCFLCNFCRLIFQPGNVIGHCQGIKHWDNLKLNKNLFSLHLESLSCSNKKIVRELTSKINDKIKHFSIVYEIGTSVLCFFCKYCHLFLQEQEVENHINSPLHLKAIAQKSEGKNISESNLPKAKESHTIKVVPSKVIVDSTRLAQSTSRPLQSVLHNVSHSQQDLIGSQINDLDKRSKGRVKWLFSQLKDSIHYFKLTYQNEKNKLLLTCKACNIVLHPHPENVNLHPWTNHHKKNLLKNLFAVKIASISSPDKEIVRKLCKKLNHGICFFSLTFQCGSNRICFVCNLCNITLLPEKVSSHNETQKHGENLNKNLFSLNFDSLSDSNKIIVRQVMSKIKNKIEEFSLVYKIGTEELQFYCKYCSYPLKENMLLKHLQLPAHLNAKSKKSKVEIVSFETPKIEKSHSIKTNPIISTVASSGSIQSSNNVSKLIPQNQIHSRDLIGFLIRDLNSNGKKTYDYLANKLPDKIHFYKITSWDGSNGLSFSCKVCNVAVLSEEFDQHSETNLHLQNLRKNLFAVKLESFNDDDQAIVKKLTELLNYQIFFLSLTFKCGSEKLCFVCNLCNIILKPENVVSHCDSQQHKGNLNKNLFSLNFDSLSDSNKKIVGQVISKIKNKIDDFNLIYKIGTEKLQFYCKYCGHNLKENTIVKHLQLPAHLNAKSKKSKVEIVSFETPKVEKSHSIKTNPTISTVASSASSQSCNNVLQLMPKNLIHSGDLIGFPIKDLSDAGKKTYDYLANKLPDKIHFYKITYWNGFNGLSFSCKVCNVAVLSEEFDQHSETNLHLQNLRKNLFAVKLESFNDDDQAIVKRLTELLNYQIFFLSLTFKCGSEKLCFVCNLCNIILKPENVVSHCDSQQHKENLNKNLFSLNFDSLSDSNKKIVRQVISKIKNKIDDFNLIYKIGTEKLQFYCKYCGHNLKENTIVKHLQLPAHLNAKSKKSKVEIVSFETPKVEKSHSIKTNPTISTVASSASSQSSNNVLQLMPKNLIHSGDLIGFPIKDLSDAGKKTYDRLANKLPDKIHFYKITYWNGFNGLSFSCKVCNVAVLSEEFYQHTETNLHLQNLQKNLFAVKLESFNDGDQEIVRRLTQLLNDQIFFLSLTFKCGSNELCFVCNLCNMILKPEIVVSHCDSQQHKENLNKILFCLNFEFLSESNKAIIVKICSEIKNKIDDFNLIYKIGTEELRFYCKYCRMILKQQNLKEHILSLPHLKAAPKKCEVKNTIPVPQYISNESTSKPESLAEKNLKREQAKERLNQELIPENKRGANFNEFTCQVCNALSREGLGNIRLTCGNKSAELLLSKARINELWTGKIERVENSEHKNASDAQNISDSSISNPDSLAEKNLKSQQSQERPNQKLIPENERGANFNEFTCQVCNTTLHFNPVENRGLFREGRDNIRLNCGNKSAELLLSKARINELWTGKIERVENSEHKNASDAQNISDSSISNPDSLAEKNLKSQQSQERPNQKLIPENERGANFNEFTCQVCNTTLHFNPVENRGLFREGRDNIRLNCGNKSAELLLSKARINELWTGKIERVENSEHKNASDAQNISDSSISNPDSLAEKNLKSQQSQERPNQKLIPENERGANFNEFTCQVCNTTLHFTPVENHGLFREGLGNIRLNCGKKSAELLLSKARINELWTGKTEKVEKFEHKEASDQPTSSDSAECSISAWNNQNSPEDLEASTEEIMKTLIAGMSSKISQIAKIIRDEWNPQNQYAPESRTLNGHREEGTKEQLLDEVSLKVFEAKNIIQGEKDPTNWPTVKYTALDDSNKEIVRKLTIKIGQKINDFDVKFSSVLNKLRFHCKFCLVIMYPKTAEKHVHLAGHLRNAHLGKLVAIFESLNDSNKKTVKHIFQILNDSISYFDVTYAAKSDKLCFLCRFCKVTLNSETVIDHAVNNKEHLSHLSGCTEKNLALSDPAISISTFVSNGAHLVDKNDCVNSSSSHTKESLAQSYTLNSSLALKPSRNCTVSQESGLRSSSSTKENSVILDHANSNIALFCDDVSKLQTASCTKEMSVALNHLQGNLAPKSGESNPVICQEINHQPSSLTMESTEVLDSPHRNLNRESNKNNVFRNKDDKNLSSSFKKECSVVLDPTHRNLSQELNVNNVIGNKDAVNVSLSLKKECCTVLDGSNSTLAPKLTKNLVDSNSDHVNRSFNYTKESSVILSPSTSILVPKNGIHSVNIEKWETWLSRPIEECLAALNTLNRHSPHKPNENVKISCKESENQLFGHNSDRLVASGSSSSEGALSNENHVNQLLEVANRCQAPTSHKTQPTYVSKISNQNLPDWRKEAATDLVAPKLSKVLPAPTSGKLSESPHLIEPAVIPDKTEIMEQLTKKIGDRINELSPLEIDSSKFGFKCKVCRDTIITPKNVEKHLITEIHLRYLPLLRLQNFETMTEFDQTVVKNLYKKMKDRIFYFYVTHVDELKKLCFLCQFCHVTLLEETVVKHACLVKNHQSPKYSKYSKDAYTSIEDVALKEVASVIGNRVNEFFPRYQNSKLYFECKLCESNLPPTNVKSHVNLHSHINLRPLMKFNFETLDREDRKIVRDTFSRINDRIFDFRLTWADEAKELQFVCQNCSVQLSPLRVDHHVCNAFIWYFYCYLCDFTLGRNETLENHVLSKQHLINLPSMCPFNNVIMSCKDFEYHCLLDVKSLVTEIGCRIACFDFYYNDDSVILQLRLFCKVCLVKLSYSSAKAHLEEPQHLENLGKTWQYKRDWYRRRSPNYSAHHSVFRELLSTGTSQNAFYLEWKTPFPYCELCEITVAAHETPESHACSRQHLMKLPVMRSCYIPLLQSIEELNPAELSFFKSLASRIGARLNCFVYFQEGTDRRYFDLVPSCRVCMVYCGRRGEESHVIEAGHLENLRATCFGRFKDSWEGVHQQQNFSQQLPHTFVQGNSLAKQILNMMDENISNRDYADSIHFEQGTCNSGYNEGNPSDRCNYDIFGFKTPPQSHATIHQDPRNLRENSAAQSSSDTSWCSLM